MRAHAVGRALPSAGTGFHAGPAGIEPPTTGQAYGPRLRASSVIAIATRFVTPVTTLSGIGAHRRRSARAIWGRRGGADCARTGGLGVARCMVDAADRLPARADSPQV